MRSIRDAALLFSVLATTACGTSKNKAAGFDAPETSDGGGADGSATPSADTLKVEPADAVLDVSDGKPNSLPYKATVLHPDATSQDVTATTTFVITGFGGNLGAFAGSTFTASPGKVGQTTVQATRGALTGTTSLTLRKSTTIIGPGAGADAPSHFGGPEDPSLKPSVVYPPDGTMVPPNMNVIEVHYQPSGANLFELHVVGPVLDLKVYFGCQAVSGGCAYVADSAVWSLISSAGRGTEPLTYTLRGSNGSKVGTAPPRKIAFGQEDILGGIYYWNAGAGATMRYEFGVSGQKAETYYSAGATCVGCHVLSRSGKKIALGFGIPGPATYQVYDVATKTTTYAQGASTTGNFFSFSPDESQILTSNGISIGLHKATDGSAITDPLVPNGTMPDWAPDGHSIVYAKPSSPPPPGLPGIPGTDSASLETLTNASGSWSPGATLVPSGSLSSYYPTYSPDGQWVLFNRARSGGDSGSFDATDAEVWVVPAKGGAPLQLVKSRAIGGDSWPKWTPDVQPYGNKTLLWFTFSSRRAYGLKLPSGTRAQIWMAAFDPSAAASGKDPSLPAFWLPFQDMQTGNHIAQWVTHVERKPCGQGGSTCDPSDQCQGGRCVPVVK